MPPGEKLKFFKTASSIFDFEFPKATNCPFMLLHNLCKFDINLQWKYVDHSYLIDRLIYSSLLSLFFVSPLVHAKVLTSCCHCCCS